MPWRTQLQSEHDDRKRNRLWRARPMIGSPQGRTLEIDGQTYLNFCSNDYLGLANDARVNSVVAEAVLTAGTGSGASHLVCGHSSQHHELELQLASFVDAEKAVVFSTGYMANLAIPQTFLKRGDLVLQDKLNHASLIDAGRYCEATMKRYPHSDVERVDTLLSKLDADKKMVITDGVFSMDGDSAEIERLQTITSRHGAVLVVDDAHGFGVLGETGAGSLEAAEIRPSQNVLMVGTFGKSVGGMGAFVAGDACYIESLVQHARSYIYTTALPPGVVAGVSESVRIIKEEPQRRLDLIRNISHFRNWICELGLPLSDSRSPIQPLVLGSASAALKASQILREQGIWVTAIRPPTVPTGSARLRITLTSKHRLEDIDQLVSVLGSEAIRESIKEAP